ncbi:MAG: hypothetical protein NC040_05345 [Muribaculaceae bacterium]|nr:hypothetical protein [Alistipes senegalensis]MCM1473460.1 hypothetical protein [Muribaculaceae bacterium]
MQKAKKERGSMQSLLDEYQTRLENTEKDVAELPELKEKLSVAEQEMDKQKAEFEAQIIMLKKYRNPLKKSKKIIKNLKKTLIQWTISM